MVLNSLKTRIVLTTMGILALSLSVITYYLVDEAKGALTNSINRNALNILDVTKGYIESQHKIILKNQQQMRSIKSHRVKNNTMMAHALLKHYYQQYLAGHSSEEHAKKLAAQDIVARRSSNDLEYFWINNISEPYPKIIMHSEIPKLAGSTAEGKNFGCVEKSGINFFQLAVSIGQKMGGGYIDCNWSSTSSSPQTNSSIQDHPKPNSPLGKHIKMGNISYAKIFKPWGWVVGSGISTEDIDQYTNDSLDALIKDTSRILEPQKIGENGYFFIFKGDGGMLLHPTLAGENVNSLKNPVTGNFIISDMKETAQTNERFIHYAWDKPEDKGNYIYKKNAFIAYYQPLDWYIATSIYPDDLDHQTSALLKRAKVIFVVFIVISLILSLFLIRSITEPLNKLIDVIRSTDSTGIPTLKIPEDNLEEIQVLSTTMNSMISRIKSYQTGFIQSESKFRSLVESLSDLIWELDINGNFTYISTQIVDLLGYEQQELIGKSPTMFMGLEESQRISTILEQVFKEEKGFQNIENKCIHKDGTSVVFEISAAPFFNENGELEGLRGINRNITEKLKVDRELRESEEKFKLLADQMLLGILIVKDGLYKYYNDAVLEIFGTTKQQMDSLAPYELQTLIDPEDRAFVMEQLKKKESGHTEDIVTNYEWRLTSKDQKIKWVESWSKTIEFDGQTADFVLLYDISERKHIQNEIVHLRNYLKNIIDSMPSMLVGVDVTGRITQWNKTAEKKTGIQASDANGRLLSEVLPNWETEIEKIKNSIKTHELKQTKMSYQTQEGNQIEEITIYPLEADGIEGAVIRIDDISEKVRMQEMMIQSEKMLSIAGLAAGMAHEINNPLAGMMQTASVISNRLIDKVDMPANKEVAEHVGTSVDAIKRFMEEREIPRMISAINESGKRAAIIVNNMLNFARKGEGGVVATQINEIIRVSIELAQTDYNMKKRYDFKKISIDTDFEQDLPDLFCDQAQIQQVLFNLLRNSAQAMQEAQIESPKVFIRTSLNKVKNKVVIELWDNGPGMAEAIRKRVFEPFFTTKPTGIGTGLGLSVSYYIIVEEHGGEMYLHSSPGAGAKFTISLPLIKEKQPSEGEQE